MQSQIAQLQQDVVDIIGILQLERNAHGHRRLCGECQGSMQPGNGCRTHREMRAKATPRFDAKLKELIAREVITPADETE